MINHPLYKRVQRIVIAKTVDGKIRQSDFNKIRNQDSVRAILIDMGYSPSCEARPFIWELNRKPVVVKQKRGITRKNILKQLQTGKAVYIKDLGVTRKYTLDLIGKLRKGGWPIESIVEKQPSKGRPKAIGYRLIEQ